MRFTGIVAFVTATCLTVTPANAAGCIGCAPSAPKEYDCAVEIRHKELEEPFLEIHAKFNDVIPIGVGLETRRIWLWQCSVLCDDVPAYWILKTWALRELPSITPEYHKECIDKAHEAKGSKSKGSKSKGSKSKGSKSKGSKSKGSKSKGH
ncbi:hypothetical protein MGG_10217 [Pyricularia oryzae 70-15]|uniref:Uncharacterized protein n=1 Tax=Pyricularia oryzae (strain 70-15 / ATCC MYA-4617 / FGSC 8958) TaxID=242507 RepID=A0A151V4Q0_PYRO7|nr:uncharacterized protein MGG_10217 [Pyricularia oryzae 70-15]KYQ30554.1 hypothetical protein MGG_10217 [Pyricularia oryzae 70-15]